MRGLKQRILAGVTATITDQRAEDRELATRAGAGDHAAFTLLFERYKTRVYRYAFLMVGDEKVAEDLYQEVFINFYKACREGTEMYNVHGYLLRSVRNRCLNSLRHTSRQVSLDEAVDLYVEIDPSDADLQKHLRAALDAIAPQYREAFLLFAVEGYTYGEIAEQIDASLDVVKNRIYRAKQALQKILRRVLE